MPRDLLLVRPVPVRLSCPSVRIGFGTAFEAAVEAERSRREILAIECFRQIYGEIVMDCGGERK